VDIDAVADRLYALPPEEFTAARDVEAKAANDADAKRAIKALRKPTAAAAAVNRLVRDRRDDVDALLSLGDDLRAAMGTDADEVRRLTVERRELVNALVEVALPVAVQQDVTATLEAATADPDVGAAVRSGRLVKPLRYAGFGVAVDIDDVVATSIPIAARGKSAPVPRKPATNPEAARSPAPKPAKQAAKATGTAPAPDPALSVTRQRVLDLAGEVDDAQRRYDAAVKRAVEARQLLDEAEAERAEAHKAARAAHAAAEKARRDLGKLERR
jgi:hypothetical protein